MLEKELEFTNPVINDPPMSEKLRPTYDIVLKKLTRHVGYKAWYITANDTVKGLKKEKFLRSCTLLMRWNKVVVDDKNKAKSIAKPKFK